MSVGVINYLLCFQECCCVLISIAISPHHLLSAISKLFEFMINKEIADHLTKNNTTK